MAYAFNKPVIFIETNVRTVYFHHFFQDREMVSDAELHTLLEQTIDETNPREFYWALMDYGTWLKKNGLGYLAKSKHYKKQAPLKGSVREVRGQILSLLKDGSMSMNKLTSKYQADERLKPALEGLLKDGLVEQSGSEFHLTK
jgi:A/G-specific adenine glycosylase